jgi:hypothetical protein
MIDETDIIDIAYRKLDIDLNEYELLVTAINTDYYEFFDDNYSGWYNANTREMVIEHNDTFYLTEDTVSPEMLSVVNNSLYEIDINRLNDFIRVIDKDGNVTEYEYNDKHVNQMFYQNFQNNK